ncbi:Tn7 transposase TnsA N-terminal domain-containing protein [Aeromonas media]|uniref:Tn7 transposase TnsA N-terminal domain-containing protein n=1 Tax=Aeromonas media TaxID=651 RepID=UPI003D02C03B
MYRRHLKHSRVKNLFKFVSAKMNIVFTVESTLEFDTCFHLEYSPSIKFYEAQPEGFYYEFAGRRCPYTPDFRVVDQNDCASFLEVKPSDKVADPDFLHRFPLKQQRAIELSSPLKLVTDKQIRIDPILGNLKLLHRYSGFQSFTPLHMQLLGLVQKLGRVSLLRLSDSIDAPQEEVLASALSLIARGIMQSDLTVQEIGISSFVWASGHSGIDHG